MSQTSLKLTYEDYLSLPDDGKRYELIDGELIVNPSPNARHQRVSRRLFVILNDYVEGNRLGEIFYAPLDVELMPANVVEPDIIYISNARAGVVVDRHVHGAPDLLVEILSESNRRHDEIVKRVLYERSGVDEYWIVDPDVERFRVYRRGVSGYDRAVELNAETDDALTTPLFPDLTIRLRRVFAER
jgi:Uma2 family endonuclease